jgi:hypothetical protein
MKKVIIFTVIMILAIAVTCWAVLPNTGPRITYGGYVERPDGVTVTADTLIWVFNPNNFAITGVGIAVFDKYGTKKADTQLIDGGNPITSIPAKGGAWQTLGNILKTTISPATKYTFVVYWTRPTLTPNRGLVAEVKEITYKRVPFPIPPYKCMMCHLPHNGEECSLCHYPPWEHKLVPKPDTTWRWPGSIWAWSEANIGRGGTGFMGN